LGRVTFNLKDAPQKRFALCPNYEEEIAVDKMSVMDIINYLQHKSPLFIDAIAPINPNHLYLTISAYDSFYYLGYEIQTDSQKEAENFAGHLLLDEIWDAKTEEIIFL